jgi:hypothetical protein
MNSQTVVSPSIPPSKKSNKLIAYSLAVISAFCVVCLIIVLAMQASTSTSKPQVEATDIPTLVPQVNIPAFPVAPANTSTAVQYQISGSVMGATITYQNATGDTEQQDISLPWTYPTFRASSGQFVYISAQIAGNDPGTITCKILVNGSVYKTSTSNGQYVIVTCSGMVP